VIEGSGIVTYKTLLETAQRIPNLDVNLIVPLLKHDLEEEINMQKWCMDNLPMTVGIL
jgi:ferritin-like metal-binding protein YciE